MSDQSDGAATVTMAEIYKAQYVHFGRLSDSIYKIPSIFSSIMGGLWYFATQHLKDSPHLSAVVFAFAALCGFAALIALKNLRDYVNAYATNLNNMDGPWKVTSKSVAAGGGPERRTSTLRAMIYLMYSATALSVAGAVLSALGLTS